MTLIQTGIYAVEEVMPCRPTDIRIGRYSLPATLERAEREEAAARILTFSQRFNRWVGVEWGQISNMMQEDLRLSKEYQETESYNLGEKQRASSLILRYWILGLLTLGVYMLFVNKPTASFREFPEKSIPFSTCFVCGSRPVVDGILELVEKGMLTQVQQGEGDDALDVFFPTPLLISAIMEKQGVRVTV